MKITILTDNPNSWVQPHVDRLKLYFKSISLATHHVFDQNDITEGDVMFILSCEKILPDEKLNLHNHNIVIHPSKLPEGKGWSPLAWQILEGCNIIPVTLFEATSQVDSGKIYLTDSIMLNGSELNDEIKQKQGECIVRMVKKYIDNVNTAGYNQSGEESFYPRMRRKHNELDINKTIAEQFNVLRVVDNNRYPAFFTINNKEYTIKIYDNEYQESKT